MSTSSPIPAPGSAEAMTSAGAAISKTTTLKAVGAARPTIDALTSETAPVGTAAPKLSGAANDAPTDECDTARTLKRVLLSARSDTDNHVSQDLIELVTESLRVGAGEYVLRLGSAAQDGGAAKAAQHQQKKTGAGGKGAEAQTNVATPDDLIGYTKDEFEKAIDNLTDAARGMDSVVTVLESRIWTVGGPDNASEREASAADSTAGSNETVEPITYMSGYVQVRRNPESVVSLIESRVAVIGNVDAGKSTLLGVLTKGGLDDGRGRARVHCFRHKHEVESGRTSSVSMEICGFDAHGEPVYNSAVVKGNSNATTKDHTDEPHRQLTWQQICERSAKVVSFIDLAGHEKYLKSTVFGLTGCLPDYVLLMVGANAGLIGMSKEHLGIALALSVPVAVVVTKIDMAPPQVLETTIKQLTKILKSPGCRKTPVFITDRMSTVDAALRLGQGRDRICPIFLVSNVTGDGLGNLRSFLNVLPQSALTKYSSKGPFEFQISDIFSVPFVGTVVSGVIVSGSVKVGDNLLIGPDSLGGFLPTTVRSIERKRVGVDVAYAGQSASFALKRIKRNMVRKGMVMLSRPLNDADPPPLAHTTCDAEVLCLYHSTTLSIGSCMVLHTQSIRQTVRIIGIAKLGPGGELAEQEEGSGVAQMAVPGGKGKTKAPGPVEDKSDTLTGANMPVVRTGDRALLRLQFIRFAEFIKVGHKLITREGKTKLIGVVRAVGATGPLVPPAQKQLDAAH
ncbi:unnamed protein product [Tilletia controversa]|uniref:Tr-type G domain-containing protein n=3 Tax=Tilletia TaxID=13289 RepID=A0A8X7MVI3_9BASI|nr:hypothetical protein CF336_g2934 [Tilletia laevis]KAE8201284.1 hypothetical protein CF328_g2718 [Tilletia controversa]KAE8262712.1 hypothetical protein A4X03_0g2243 [Tilletia caries]KAE8205475.1 hypothetical protein CF335_g2283 [Tilletia laevis]KAE8249250.1 hypothetical protein A4X06_0g3322 [Tilletia controversa]